MKIRPRILVLSEDRAIRATLLRLVADADVDEVRLHGDPAVILIGCGARLCASDLASARAVSQVGRNVPIVLVTSQSSEELAIEALRAGITNYLRLPLTPAELAQELESIAGVAPPGRHMDRMIGVSQALEEVRRYLYRAASCASNVLITGETGTGKELAADLIHRHSPRAARPLITVNCAALPDNLIESELFGFERGAFTGAHAAQDGKFKLADGGTVFLDEVGDLSAWAQAKVLRAIETGEIQRLGGRKPQRVDVRIIAATNRDLETDGGFRKDLYFRLNVARVELPPLRQRKDDILPLAEAFRGEFDKKFGCRTKAFTAGARQLLLAHRWPGNVRELRNIVEAAFIDPGPDAASEIEMPPRFREALRGAATEGELERILLALSRTQWNKSRAADELHWSRMTLYRKMARHKIAAAGGNGL
jgi:DNA-binding NtrC family response regulator